MRIAVAFLLCGLLQAAEPVPYVYRVISHTVTDGDTLALVMDLGFGLRLHMSVRLDGLNAPEITGAERPAGLVVAERVRQWTAQAQRLYVRSTARDKFAGRFVGVLINEAGESLNDWLLQQGLAKPYDGRGPMPRFSAEEIKTILSR